MDKEKVITDYIDDGVMGWDCPNCGFGNEDDEGAVYVVCSDCFGGYEVDAPHKEG